MSGSSSVAAQISPIDRSTSLPIETRPAKPTPRALPRDISAPIMVPECEAKNVRPTGMSGSAKAALAVSITPSRRLTTPRLDGPMRRMPVSAATSLQTLLARDAVRAGLGEAGRQDGGDLHARPAAFGYRVDHGLGRHHHIGVVRRLGQRRDGLPGALAEHGLAARIDADRSCRESPPGAGISAAGRWSWRRRPTGRSIATERGESSAWRRAARSTRRRRHADFRRAKRRGVIVPFAEIRGVSKPFPSRP